jgi:hypothetical protein
MLSREESGSYVAELAEAGVKLAASPTPTDSHGSPAQEAFEASIASAGTRSSNSVTGRAVWDN